MKHDRLSPSRETIRLKSQKDSITPMFSRETQVPNQAQSLLTNFHTSHLDYSAPFQGSWKYDVARYIISSAFILYPSMSTCFCYIWMNMCLSRGNDFFMFFKQQSMSTTPRSDKHNLNLVHLDDSIVCGPEREQSAPGHGGKISDQQLFLFILLAGPIPLPLWRTFPRLTIRTTLLRIT